MSDINADQIDYWNAKAGQTWAQLQERLDRQLQPLGEAALEALSPQPGERILDVGCGCGQTTLALAERAGEGVLGVDVSAPMLAVAEARLKGRAALMNADAATHPFPSHSFDAVFSRFGVMFFADPQAAFVNIRLALKPGGRLAFVCWRPFAENLWMAAPMAAAAPFLPSPDAAPTVPTAPDSTLPGPFAFADPNRVRAILAAAGFADIAIEPREQPIGAGDLDASTALALRIGPLAQALAEHPGVKSEVAAAVRAALKPYETAQGVLVPSATWIVTAKT